MNEPRPILLLTRPEAQSRRMAIEARAALGDAVEVIEAPLARIVDLPLEVPLPDARGFIATSENAVHAGVRLGVVFRGQPVWCVGSRTARAAKAAGADVYQGEGDARVLSDRIVAASPATPLLWLRGERVAVDLAERLNNAGIDTVSRVIYRTEAQPLPVDVRNRLDGAPHVILPLMSDGSGQRLADALKGLRTPITLAAISASVAKAWKGPPARKVLIAKDHSSTALIAAIRAMLL